MHTETHVHAHFQLPATNTWMTNQPVVKLINLLAISLLRLPCVRS